MTTENLFIQASRAAYRFETARGILSIEDLWSMPLQSKSGFDLDSVAKLLNSQVIEAGDTSFVSTTISPRKAAAEARLEIVKFIIATKLAEAEAASTAAARKAQRDKLIAVLGEKQDAQLKEMTAEEIQAQIAALG